MNIQERYDEIAALSGCPEQVVRRVMKAVQQSLVKSLRQGTNATLPGVCTLYPEIRSKLDPGGRSSTKYVKIKAKASSALETEFSKLQSFDKERDVDLDKVLNIRRPELHNIDKDDESGNTENVQIKLATDTPVRVSVLTQDRYGSKDGVRTKQINALL